MRNLTLGAIILYKNIPGFTSWLQRIVLGIPYSHSSIYIGKNELGRAEEFEANLEVGTTTFVDSVEYREVYNIRGVPHPVMEKVLNELINEFEENTYGFISWVAIFIRRCFELCGFNAKGWNILWGWGVQCTELVYHFLVRLAKIMEWHDLEEYLYMYNPDLFHSGDLKLILDTFNNYFKKLANGRNNNN